MKIHIGVKHRTKDSAQFSIRSLLAVVVALGLTCFVLEFTNRFYYKPLCQRHAESRRLTYDGYTMGWRKHDWPAECFFLDRNGNSKRIEVADITLTSDDWTRWILSSVAMIAGVGGSVWLASLIGGFKVRRRRH